LLFRLLLVLLLALAAAPAVAQGTTDEEEEQLRELRAAIAATQERADRLAARQAILARESQSLSDELTKVAAEARDWQEEVTQVENTLEALVEESELRRQQLVLARRQLASLTGALLRISLLPPETLIARRNAPGEMVRAGLVMRRLVPRLEARAVRLKQQVADLQGLEKQIEAENAEALEARRRLAEEQDRLAMLLQRRRDLLSVTERERAEAEAEAQELEAAAQDLSGLVESTQRRVSLGPPQVPPQPPKERKVALLEDFTIDPSWVPPKREPEPPPAEAEASPQTARAEPQETRGEVDLPPLRPLGAKPGGMTMPVTGRVVSHFLEGNQDHQGIRLAGKPGAPVLAPFDGVVVYAGPFRSYGLVLILEHGGGYHSVLAELGLIDALLGQRVTAGEPIGALSEGSAAEGAGGSPEMYLELRRNGTPVDPEAWTALAEQ